MSDWLDLESGHPKRGHLFRDVEQASSNLSEQPSALLSVYKRLPLKIVRGQGSYLFDDRGGSYLDMYAGHAVAATGHGHPVLVAALQEQIAKLLFYSNFVALEHQEEAAYALAAELPESIEKVFFVNSGSEAVENALKIARKVTGKSGVIGFHGGFHGRTLGALAATGIEKYRHTLGTVVEGHYFAEFGDVHEVERLIASHSVAAVILEPIQSLAGVRSCSVDFLQQLRDLCHKHGVILIFDELQTGGGRSGGSYCFAPQHSGGVIPDIVTLGKGIGSGLPMAVCATSEAIASHIKVGDLGTTFGGGPLACLALKTTIDIIKSENLYQAVLDRRKYLQTLLAPWSRSVIGEIRGVGLLLGLKTIFPASVLQKELLSQGVIAGTSEDPYVLRLMPPLTVSNDEVLAFSVAFSNAVTALLDHAEIAPIPTSDRQNFKHL